ncbi:MAG: tetratricopeptide repeat protein [Planctomycetaceae bacterium]|nr:tetratricopeptide repeat protein [Planctomycetaceae bacterium]
MTHAAPPAAAHASATPSPRRARPLWQLGVMAVGVVLLGGSLAWYLVSPAAPSPGERLRKAVELLQTGEIVESRKIADELVADGYHDEELPGGVEYVLGMCHFREAGEQPAEEGLAQFATAIVYLRDAEERGMPEEYRPELAHALAACLFRSGSRMDALPLLEEASQSAAPAHSQSAANLIELYLDPGIQTPERLQTAVQLSDRLLKQLAGESGVEDVQRQRVEISLALKDYAAAEKQLAEFKKLESQQAAATVLEARLWIGKAAYPEAVKLLEPIASDEAADAPYARQACYLMGLAADRQAAELAAVNHESAMRAAENNAGRAEYRQRALEFYRKTVAQFEKSEEAVAAAVQLGRLQQEDGADEKAIQSFGSALRTVQRAEDFTNRWMTLDDFRQQILAAWNRWIEMEHFTEAIALADLMAPAFPRDQAYELAARSRQLWAEKADAKQAKLTSTARVAGAAELQRLWRESATAFTRLAEARRGAANSLEAVWRAADHSYRGKDFDGALKAVDLYLSEAAVAMRPVALVRRGLILLDLDRVSEAEENFGQVRREFPTSPAAFTARYQLAVCRMEQNDLDGADAGWRSILTSNELTPAAIEWRDALLALAKLQGDRAGWARRRVESQALGPEELETLWTEVAGRSREATEFFEQFLSRYPSASQVPEVQYHLGKALQLQGDVWRRQWQSAETENARDQSSAEMRRILERALLRFQQVREAFAEGDKNDQLTMVQRRIYENAWFELPHTLFALDRFQDAITAYAATVHRFPQDVRVLTAYVQMAEAYARLNRLVEARSMLEQAKVMLDQDQIPPTAFNAPITTLTRQEWEQWLDRARKVHRE